MQNTILKTWQKKSAWPLVILSLLYTFAYVFPIFAFPIPNFWNNVFHSTEYTIWALFVIDYGVQVKLASNKKEFFRSEVISMVLVVIPFLRPIRAIRGIVFLRHASTRPEDSVLMTLPWVIASVGALMMLIMAAAVLNVERFAPNSTIHNTGDALWWSLVTVTTIGYGDKYPVTGEGRILAAVLIIFGIGLVASLTGYFASAIIKQVSTSVSDAIKESQ
jgi:voltage-gated potassium channel